MIQLRLRTPPHTLRRSLASRPIRGGHRWVEGPKIKVGRTGGRCSCHVPPGDEPAAQGRRPREPICRGRGAGVGKRARRGRGRARPGGAPRAHAEGTREAEEAARASGTGRRGAWNHLQRVRDRLGARSSAMTKTTTQPAVRAEGRSPRQARSPPAWRIETSLRRKRVRGGGSRRARAVRQGPTHLTPARERVASSADLSAPRMAPLGAETPRKPVNATASCRETAGCTAPGPAEEDRRVRSGHARLPEPWRHQIEGWSAAGALAGGGGSSGVAGARGGVNVLHARRAGPGALRKKSSYYWISSRLKL